MHSFHMFLKGVRILLWCYQDSHNIKYYCHFWHISTAIAVPAAAAAAATTATAATLAAATVALVAADAAPALLQLTLLSA